MSAIKWMESYSIGYSAIDEEHKRLVEQIALLYREVRDKGDGKVVGDVLKALAAYTEEHFAHEEKLMAEQSYPDIEVQREAHGTFKETLSALQKKFETGGNDPLTPEIYQFVRHWLIDHILTLDKKLGEFLAKPA